MHYLLIFSFLNKALHLQDSDEKLIIQLLTFKVKIVYHMKYYEAQLFKSHHFVTIKIHKLSAFLSFYVSVLKN